MEKSSCLEFPDNCAKHIRKPERLQALDGEAFNGGFGEFGHSSLPCSFLIRSASRAYESARLFNSDAKRG